MKNTRVFTLLTGILTYLSAFSHNALLLGATAAGAIVCALWDIANEIRDKR